MAGLCAKDAFDLMYIHGDLDKRNKVRMDHFRRASSHCTACFTEYLKRGSRFDQMASQPPSPTPR